jgi:hypothetical protein
MYQIIVLYFIIMHDQVCANIIILIKIIKERTLMPIEIFKSTKRVVLRHTIITNNWSAHIFHLIEFIVGPLLNL